MLKKTVFYSSKLIKCSTNSSTPQEWKVWLASARAQARPVYARFQVLEGSEASYQLHHMHFNDFSDSEIGHMKSLSFREGVYLRRVI